MEFQVRFDEGQLFFFETLKEAMEFANKNIGNVWKVSFTIPETNERVRLISRYDGMNNKDIWVYEPIIVVL